MDRERDRQRDRHSGFQLSSSQWRDPWSVRVCIQKFQSLEVSSKLLQGVLLCLLDLQGLLSTNLQLTTPLLQGSSDQSKAAHPCTAPSPTIFSAFSLLSQ